MTTEEAFYGAVLGALAWIYQKPPSPTIRADQGVLIQPYLDLRAAEGISREQAADEFTAEIGALFHLSPEWREHRLALLKYQANQARGAADVARREKRGVA